MMLYLALFVAAALTLLHIAMCLLYERKRK